MSVYPGAPRLITNPHYPADRRYVLDDAALAQSMAKAIEDAMGEVFQREKGKPIPEVGKEDRLLYVAISRGILRYLADHQVTMRTNFTINGTARTGHIDLNVTMDEHLPHS
jgi:hypothetical protein